MNLQISQIHNDYLYTLTSNYSIGEVAGIYKLSGGVENNNYLITTNAKKYVLREYNKQHSIKGMRRSQDIDNELRFVMACQSVIPVAEPVLNNSGVYYTVTNSGTYYALFSHKIGMVPSKLNRRIVAIYAKMVSKMYDISLNFSVSPTIMQHDIVHRALMHETFNRQQNAEINSCITRLKEQVNANMNQILRLPGGIIHGDIKLANTLFYKDELTALLDFDDCRYSFLLEETVMTIMHSLTVPSQNILRSGYLPYFLQCINNIKLKKDIKEILVPCIQARLLYDIYKLAQQDPKLTIEIINDKYVKEYL